MLQKLFELGQDALGLDTTPEKLPADQVPLAAAALMVEGALMDGHFDDAERAMIRSLLVTRLDVSDQDADATLAEAERQVAEASDHWSFARTLKNRLDEPDRIGILEMLWEVAYADGEVHDMEAALIRKVAGLLYVRDQDSGAARRRVRARLGID